ncbi:endonuclease/exonuclease/phosphatase family protein [Phaeobacter sp. B1627]|uniref:endonuclease/exonuclease/phosphatase family protein n=1 Tax=Phaeobacter sp. B1627 TaxID=2583809 RepID=UPI001119BF33|nr:endonuclease/exonuclease/phosphatase family protein [Phaeobacter sp. B1627]TNJ40890.1 endonuclease [Phaeobacter sp. B1627]
MRRTAPLRLCGWVVLAGSLVCLLGGFLGWLHPLGDSLAVFRLPFAGVAMICAFALRRDPRAALCGVLATSVVLTSWLSHMARAEDPSATAGLTLYQKNMLFNNKGNDALVQSILDLQPDVITLEEVSAQNMAVLATLQPQYPVQQVCPFRAVGGVAVLARAHRVVERLDCVPDLGLAAVRLATETGPLWVAALHLPWPWPHEQNAKVDATVAQLSALDGPMVLAGDFNAVGWSHALDRIARAGGMARVGPYVGTFDLPPLGYAIGIDHVLAPAGAGHITVLPKFTSDHHGLLAEIRSPLPQS